MVSDSFHGNTKELEILSHKTKIFILNYTVYCIKLGLEGSRHFCQTRKKYCANYGFAKRLYNLSYATLKQMDVLLLLLLGFAGTKQVSHIFVHWKIQPCHVYLVIEILEFKNQLTTENYTCELKVSWNVPLQRCSSLIQKYIRMSYDTVKQTTL